MYKDGAHSREKGTDPASSGGWGWSGRAFVLGRGRSLLQPCLWIVCELFGKRRSVDTRYDVHLTSPDELRRTDGGILRHSHTAHVTQTVHSRPTGPKQHLDMLILATRLGVDFQITSVHQLCLSSLCSQAAGFGHLHRQWSDA